MWNLIIAVVVIGAAAWGLSFVIRRLTVFEYQHALLFTQGKFTKLLDPGTYWFLTLNSRVDVIDARPRVMTIPGQEVLSADGVSIKVSLLIQYQVTDPKNATFAYQSYEETLYAHAQTLLRKLVGEVPIEKLLESRNEISEGLQTGVSDSSEVIGVNILSLAIKDIMFPGTLKDAFSQVARAKQEGLAALEKARGEAAAMRNLANTAKLLDGNPNLYNLRLLQTINEAGSVVLRLDKDGVPEMKGVN